MPSTREIFWFLPDPELMEDVQSIRNALISNPGFVVNMECFNVTEAEEIASHLSEDEIERVGFSVACKNKEPETIKLRKFVK